MGLISKTISGFFNGISQQAATSRRDNQGAAQVNALGTLVDGLIKRPPTEHLAVLSSQATSGSFIHKINRDVNERYMVIITGDATEPIEVFKLDGTKCTVQYGQLAADLTFTADATVKGYVTTTGNAAKQFKALTIADRTFIVNTSTTIEMTTDVAGGTVTGRKQTFVDLPGSPATGEIWEITGDDLTYFDNYHMKWDGSVWVECLKPGLETTIDANTMPHQLTRTGVDTFTFAPNIWTDRLVGDENSNMLPSFIDKTMNNILFFKNRLGFLSADNVILSRSGKHFDFFRQTALDLLADDPIDTSATAKSVETLRSSAIFDKSLLLLADQQQFDLGSEDGALTPTNSPITPTTRFLIDPDAEPITAGANVYFVCPMQKYVAIREYFIQSDTMLNDAADVTAHVPRYIPKGFIQLESLNSMDILFVHSDALPNTMFVYKYYWLGDEKPQSAWSKWEFDGEVLGMKSIDSVMYLFIKRGTEISFEKMNIDKVNTGDLNFRVHLDRQIELTGVYADGVTTWTLPFVDTDTLEAVASDTGLPLLGLTNNEDGTVSRPGDYSAKEYIFGKAYTMLYRLSEWYIKNQQGAVLTEGRIQIRSLTLSFTETGYFRVEVTPLMRDTLVHEFTGTYVGISRIGQVSLADGEEKFIVMAKSKQTIVDIVNDSYLPTELHTGSWEGFYHARAKPI